MSTSNTWHAGRILFALARYFQWFQQRMITEYELGGLREDLVMVSRAGYATVVEIKVSLADWKRDAFKNRAPGRGQVSRLFYAVPQALFEAGIPDSVPEAAGVLVVSGGGHWAGYDSVHEERPAVRFKAQKLSDLQLRKIDEAFYFRFWRQHMDLERQRLFERPKRAALLRGEMAAA